MARLQRILLSGLLLSAASGASGQTAVTVKPPSYGELAGQMLCGPLDELVRSVTNFHAATLPHEAKELRKQLGKFRNRLDLFAFAYPTGPGKDRFLQLRDDIDKGYERMGDFKDLFDVQRLDLAEFDAGKQKWSRGVRPEAVTYADGEKLKSRRDKVLKWQEKFLEPERLTTFRAYICAPDRQALHARNAKDLSRFFWGSEEGLTPRLELSGVDNFRWLAAESLSRALKDYPRVQELRGLEGETAVKFHDFRKRIRSVVKITEDIELLPASQTRAGELHELLDDLDDRYGGINDKIVDLGMAVESGNASKSDRLRSEITSEWEKLRQWQVERQVSAGMTEYIALLRSLMPTGKPGK